MLPPDLEAKIRACELQAKRLFDEAVELEDTLVDLTDQIDSGELDPVATWNDPSVVRHVEELRRTTDRVRRESDTPIRRAATNGNRR